MNGVGLSGRIAGAFLDNKLTPLLVAASLLLGVLAVLGMPREEEPQIVVPMMDVAVSWPGATADEVERLVTIPLERALREIPEVEYTYATSRPSGSLVVARFYVGSDPERALVRTRDRVASAARSFPPGALPAEVVPRSIDDVPILAVTLSSRAHDGLALRRMAAELEEEIRSLPEVAATTIHGGLRREIRVELDAQALAARGLAPSHVVAALGAAGRSLPAGSIGVGGREILVETGGFLRTAEEVGAVVVAAPGGRPVHVREVARVLDGPEEPETYVLHLAKGRAPAPAVTLAVAKTRGANATVVAERVLRRIEEARPRTLPEEVELTVTRNYGETARDKSNELMKHLLLATVSVVLLMALALGWRDALVVAVAVPVTLALTLLVYYLMDTTLNRVTLFALIFSIGILVDDAIVVVENIHRHLALRRLPPDQASVFAVDEVGNPTVLATLTVIAAILPMAFVSGLMGPYMRPIPVGASIAMIISLLVAFVVSPWLALRLLARGAAGASHGPARPEPLVARAYRRAMEPLLDRPRLRIAAIAAVLALLVAAVALVPTKLVTVKMLPFDNKSELQVIVDAPEGTALEDTLAAGLEMAEALQREPEVQHVQVYAGTSAPFNFNGLVRHDFLRRGANVADLQVNLVPREERRAASHEVALRLRPLLEQVARRRGVRVKVAEIPPGPPVLATLVAEIYGEELGSRLALAREVLQVFETTEGVVDTDWYVEDPQPKDRFVVLREKASLSGVDPEQVALTLRLAVAGVQAALAHPDREREPVPVVVRFPRAERAAVGGLSGIRLASSGGALVPLSEVTEVSRVASEPFLYRKNGQPVTYVIGDVAGEEESPVYAILAMSPRLERIGADETFDVRLVDGGGGGPAERLVWDGEWRITYEVFRDLGIAFGSVLALIYVLVVAWFRSFVTPLIIMAPIPLTLVGILPGHALAGLFFTATSMIGVIALAGIIVRNSILLVDFVELSLERGLSLREAVLEAGAVRLRPILLTAAAIMVGGAVMVLDPIFQGLAASLISGVFASTVLTLLVIPLLYHAVARRWASALGHAPDPEAKPARGPRK